MRAQRRLGDYLWSIAVVFSAVFTACAWFVTAADAGGQRQVAKLGVGDSVFWGGEHVEASEPGPEPLPIPTLLNEESAVDDCAEPNCFEYRIELIERGAVFRVAIDTPDCVNDFTLELVSPSGAVKAQDSSCYSAEVYVDDPAKGTWLARVTPMGSEAAVFRMRAKLEGNPIQPSRRRALLPNLRVEPPHEFGFGDEGGGLAGASSSCYEDEIVEDSAQRCLRFAVGPQNVGAGPLEIKFARTTNVGTEAAMYQRVYYNDGTSTMRDAGSSEFHKTHQHFHLKGFATFELLRVKHRDTGKLVPAGTGHKSGFCLVDMRIARWRSFDQQRSYSARSNCMPVGGKAELGLSAGWTDVYGAALSGNYVDFGDNPDGRYVIRTVVDSLDHILESKERDNVGYAYVSIKGPNVTLLERGQGTGPWDPNKIVSRWPR